MKHALTLLLALAAAAHAQFAVMHTNGVVTSPTNLTIQQSNVSGLSNALAGKLGTNPTLAISNTTGLQTALDGKLATNGTLQVSNVSGLQSALDGKLGFNATNGQVQWTNTNALTFTNRPILKGPDTTNIPALFWDTSDSVGRGSMLAFSRAHATNLWFGINQSNWSQFFLGQNVQPTADGNNFTRINTNIGAVGLVLENEYNAEQNTNNPYFPVAEMYFVVSDRTTGGSFRPLMIVGSQTNQNLGYGGIYYPFTVGVTNLGWNAQAAFTVDYNNPSGGATMTVQNLATNSSANAEIRMVSGGGTALILQKQNRFDMFANNLPYGNIIQALTNGVVIGSSFKTSADARVQLGGDTRVDGAISFNNTTNAATTRTNLGLGGGITTNVSSGTLQFSNGILVGHTP